eukprot:507636-Pelagomonas_calceolata.AAC.2
MERAHYANEAVVSADFVLQMMLQIVLAQIEPQTVSRFRGELPQREQGYQRPSRTGKQPAKYKDSP